MEEKATFDLSDYHLSMEYLEQLKLIETGALDGQIIDKSEHFEQFFPSIKDFLIKAAEKSRNPNKTLNLDFIDHGINVPEELGSEKDAMNSILPYYNSIDTRSGRDWRNVIPVTLLPAVLGAFGAVLINPNLVTSKYGGRASELEVRVIKSLAKILGYTEIDKAGGLSVEGGTKGNMYGYLFGLRKAFPEIKEKGLMGVKKDFKFINSLGGHFSNFTNLTAIGVGTDSAVRCPVDRHGAIQIDRFREIMEDLFSKNIIVPTVLITMGSTDSSAIDNIEEVYKIMSDLCEKYPDMHRPHLHVDAAIGWAFVLFNNYDVKENRLSLNKPFLEKIQSIQKVCRSFHLADSVALDMQKTGFCPYSSSYLILKDKEDFSYLQWQPGVFKYFDPAKFEISPVMYSLECTRSPVGVYATAMALNSLGIEGYQTLLAASLQYVELLKKRFRDLGNVGIINPNLGFTCLFRPYPSFVKNAEEVIQKELYDPDFQEKSNILTVFESGFYEYWSKHKKPRTPMLDHVATAGWSQYDDNEYELCGWKAYMLNPRCGYFMDQFWDEFIELRNEYEAHLPRDYMKKLRDLFEA